VGACGKVRLCLPVVGIFVFVVGEERMGNASAADNAATTSTKSGNFWTETVFFIDYMQLMLVHYITDRQLLILIECYCAVGHVAL